MFALCAVRISFIRRFMRPCRLIATFAWSVAIVEKKSARRLASNQVGAWMGSTKRCAMVFDRNFEPNVDDAIAVIADLQYLLRNNRNHIHLSPSASAAVSQAVQVIEDMIESRQMDYEIFRAYIDGSKQADVEIKRYIEQMQDKLARYESEDME